MKRLFISQPMNGLTDEQIMHERQMALEYVKNVYDEDIVLIDSFLNIENGKPLEYLAESIRLLSNADVAYFAQGWDKARGCRIEYMCANLYGIEVIV